MKAFPLAWALVCAWAVLAVGAEATAPQLLVQVGADRSVYRSGETVILEVRTFLDGQPAHAGLASAVLTITQPDGQVIRRQIREDFRRVAPGVYRATGVATVPGERTLEVRATLKRRLTCRCRLVVLQSTGLAHFRVEARPLEVALRVVPERPTLCEPIRVVFELSATAGVRLLALYPDGRALDLVIPGTLGPGEHWIRLKPGRLAQGPVTLKLVAVDPYGQRAEATAELVVEPGVCEADC